MILTYKQLPEYRKKVVMVDGCFDPVHAGHIAYFKGAANFGIPVFCAIENKGEILRSKGRPVLLEDAVRLCVVDAIRHVQYVHLNTTSTADILRRIQPVKYIKGDDWKGKLPKDETKTCRELGIEIVYLDTVSDSSSKILSEYLRQCHD